MKPLVLCAGLAGLAFASAAGAIEFRPKLEAEGRWFWEAGEEPVLGAAAGTVETFLEWGDGQRLVGEFFQRYDENDEARTHADVRELFYQVIGDDFEFRLGARRVYWGVTESRHLVDVINQSDFVEDIDAEAKLGQPMMNAAFIRAFGTIDVFLMPYQRARTFPGAEGYPRLPLPVNANEARYESPQEQRHLDSALRYVGSFGPVDLGVAWFDGTAREPRLLPCLRRGSGFQGTDNGPNCDILSGLSQPGVPPEFIPLLQALGAPGTDPQAVFDALVLVPAYDRLRQASLDAQVVTGSLALKLEALVREQQDERTAAAVTGFEYTFGDVWATGADIGVLGEYLFDERDTFLNVLFDDELFAGMRVALNDEPGTSFLGGVVANREDLKSRLYYAEASRRLGEDWKLSLETRVFSKLPRDSVESFLADQDFLTLTLERFF